MQQSDTPMPGLQQQQSQQLLLWPMLGIQQAWQVGCWRYQALASPPLCDKEGALGAGASHCLLTRNCLLVQTLHNHAQACFQALHVGSRKVSFLTQQAFTTNPPEVKIFLQPCRS